MKNLLLVVCLGLAACDSKPGSGPSGGNSPAGTGATAAAPGEAALRIPTGASAGPGVVTMEARDPSSYPGVHVAGKVWSVRVDGAEHVQFSRPAELRLPYDASLVPEGTFVTMSVWQDGAWQPVTGAVVDAASHTVSARVSHLSEYAPTLTAADIEMTARWYATCTRSSRDRAFESGPPNYWVSGMTKVEKLELVAREERLRGDNGQGHRFVIESVTGHVSWEGRIATVRESDTYMLLDPLDVTMRKSEQDLGVPVPDEYRQKVLEQWKVVDDLRTQIARGGADLESQRTSLASELRTLKSLEFWEYRSPWTVNAGNGLENDWASLSWPSSGFEYEEVTWRLESEAFGLPIGQGSQVHQKKTLGWSFDAAKKEGGLLSETRRYSSDNEWWTETSTFARLPQDCLAETHELTIRGEVLHRLLAGGGSSSDQYIGERPEQDWRGIGSRAIRVAGTARVDAHLIDPSDVIGPPTAATATTVTGPQGEFELKFQCRPEQLLRLDVIWQNEEAGIEEHALLEVPLYLPYLVASTLAPGDPFVRLPEILRRGHVFVRYAGQPTNLDLGTEARGGRMKSGGPGKLEMEFKGMDAVLLGTVCVKATHLNQNVNTFHVNARPREDEIAAACPADRLAAVQAALRAAQVDGRIPVEFEGSEICYLASTLMALNSIGLESITLNADGIALEVAGLGQRIYEEMDARAVNLARRPRHAWVAPDPATDWPFVAADAHDENKHWLLSIRGGDGDRWRAWQDPDLLKSALETLYPLIRIEIIGEDLFTEAGRRSFLRRFANGAGGVCRIAHVSGGRDLGHVLAFLGVVLGPGGNCVRTIFHDPFGDLSWHPEVDGYYGSPRDIDPSGHRGAFAPYGFAPHSTPAGLHGTLRSQRYLAYTNSSAVVTPEWFRARLLPGVVR